MFLCLITVTFLYFSRRFYLDLWKTNAKKCWPQSLGIWNESGSPSQVSAACGGLGRSAGLASAHSSHSGERRAVIISVRMHRINRELKVITNFTKRIQGPSMCLEIKPMRKIGFGWVVTLNRSKCILRCQKPVLHKSKQDSCSRPQPQQHARTRGARLC